MKKTSSQKAKERRNQRIKQLFIQRKADYTTAGDLFADIAEAVGCNPGTVRNVAITLGLYTPAKR